MFYKMQKNTYRILARAVAWPKYAGGGGGGGAVPPEQVPGGNSSVNFGDK